MSLPEPYYQDDSCTIYHGDCREILPELERESVDLVLTDPPYGLSYATNRKVRGKGASWVGTTISSDRSTSLRDDVLEWAEGLPAFVFGSWKVERPSATRAVLIWDKGPASGMGDLSFPWKLSYEEIYVIGSGFEGKRDESVIKDCHVVTWESRGRFHPNSKPIPLIMRLLLKTSANCILDPFMGSGTTLLAAKNLGRKAIGVEVEEKYAAIAVQRLAQEVLPLETA